MHTCKACDLPIHLSVFKGCLSFYCGTISFESNQLKSEHGYDILTDYNLDIWVGILARMQKRLLSSTIQFKLMKLSQFLLRSKIPPEQKRLSYGSTDIGK